MVGRCIPNWNSPFLGGHVSLRGCKNHWTLLNGRGWINLHFAVVYGYRSSNWDARLFFCPRMLRIFLSNLTNPPWTGIHPICQSCFKTNTTRRFLVLSFSQPKLSPHGLHDNCIRKKKKKKNISTLLVGTPNHHAFTQELHRIGCIRIQIIQRTDRIPSTVPIKELLIQSRNLSIPRFATNGSSWWMVPLHLPIKGRLVGGFNPFEKYQANWIISPSRVENKKYLKPPASRCHVGIMWLVPKKKKNHPNHPGESSVLVALNTCMHHLK